MVDFATGAGGFYSDSWVLAFFASAGAMLVLLSTSIAIGVRVLRRRGRPSDGLAVRLSRVLAESLAFGGLVVATNFDIGGYAIPLLADFSVLLVVWELIVWNLMIRRALTSSPGLPQVRP
jgi:hypothetical protein